jgi:RimJ/RimL family protein N-acetyltransferase
MAWLAGERVTLRAWERDDVRLRWEADQTPDAHEPRMRDWHEPPVSLQRREQEFDAQQSEPDPTVVALVIETDGHVVGDINIFDIDQRNRSAIIGLSIWHGEDRGRGYASDAMRTMLAWAFDQMNLHRIELTVDPRNIAARRVYEKMGFVEEGRRREGHFDGGRYTDEVMMGLLDREFRARYGCAP